MKKWQKGVLAVVVLYAILLFGPLAGFDLSRITQEIARNPFLLIQQLLIGVTNGAIIAIIALGYTMVYGIIELINFAHGDLFMLGAFASLTVMSLFGVEDGMSLEQVLIPLGVAFFVAPLFCAVLNVFTERYAYRPLRHAPRLAPLITAIGFSFIFQNVGLFWGSLKPFIPLMGSNSAAPKSFPDILPKINLLEPLGITTIAYTTKDLIVLLAAVMMMAGLQWFVQSTRLGKAMRATAQNRAAAQIVGIDVDGIIALTFFMGGALAGAGGLLVSLYNNTIVFTMGFTIGLRAFTAAVLGGIGNIVGAMLGGVLIGILSALSDQYFSSRWTNAWVFLILVLILVFRPTGLLGENVQEKV
jgi:branched-chain amino acid transport system permease protein